jgi:hypothetical protein
LYHDTFLTLPELSKDEARVLTVISVSLISDDIWGNE